ncbi:GMCL1 protein, partial [Atractosteus spatula]|nr:GMCL1 protein [Atractosteus spatula]
MGGLSSRLGASAVGRPGGAVESRHSCECRKRKRNMGCQCDSDGEEDPDRLLNTPRRKKLKTTSKYIYQTLFLNGENSDIRICALGQEWNLHKVYLCQSGYFSSMFSGSWKESSMTVIELEIPDQNIDTEALQVAFGSLYRDDVLIKPSRVVSILAAACMLQLDGLIQQCGETMKETITVKTVCGYYTSAGTYGLDSVKKECLEWLLNNLMTHQSVELMKELSTGMMEQLVKSPDLFVMQVEMDVYTALKKDGLIQQCGETMKETITVKTVCGYYTSAGTYGLDSVKKECLEWLLNNLMTHQSVELMKELSTGMMEQLVKSPDLFVMQVEMDVYTALKKWTFLQLHPSWNGPVKQLLADADVWIAMQKKELAEGMSFLDTPQGIPFLPVFRHVRLQYVINDLASARIVERDAILPSEWLSAVYKHQWFAMLRTEHDSDTGPQEANKEEFELNSMRCGRKLAKDGDYCWRWTGFNFGFDLLVTYTNRFIVFKRNTLSQPCGGSVSLQPRRHIAYRLRLASFDGSGKLVFSRSTGYQLLALEKDQEYVVMNLDSRLLVFPLFICCNFLYTSPPSRRVDSPEPESSSRSLS